MRESSSTYCLSSFEPSAQFRPTLTGFAWRTEFQKASVTCPESVRPLASVIVPEIMIGNVEVLLFEVTRDPEYGGLGVQRVEDGLDEQQVGPAVDEPPRRLCVGFGELVEGDVPETGVVDVGRERRRPVRRARGRPPRSEASPACREAVRRLAGDAGRLVVELVGEVLASRSPPGRWRSS